MICCLLIIQWTETNGSLRMVRITQHWMLANDETFKSWQKNLVTRVITKIGGVY
jgi:hypothetical protein